MNDILQGLMSFGSWLLSNLDNPLFGWVVGIIAVIGLFWENRKRYSACSDSLTKLVDKHGLEVKNLRRIINALNRTNEIARQKLIDGGLMEPEDDSEARKTLTELLYAKDDYPVH